ncbi:hypothetical protein [Streptomyces sp. KL118A]|uniref:hypothetical protein n=1 Tax=Streptomyces sp. KL118A TaxID=3045153 RepID=UPI00278C38C8|nr:hypothetical protein [Streptomyces sp. KL118A]
MAKSGYGKRLAGDEEPDTEPDFAHLIPRDAELATFIDHLPDGAAMGHKVIAAAHPRYGQQAVRTSLRRLTEAGHLRWVKEHIIVEDGSMRWVTRTYWSRKPKSVAWWAEFVRAWHGRDVTDAYQPGLARVTEPEPEPDPASPRDDESTAAHRTLVQLRTADRRMALSEGECKQLEPSAAEWLARGATPSDITRALTEGLPPTVTNPGGLARTRLENKMPPKRQAPAKARARITRAVMVCPFCDEPETSVQLVNGICMECMPAEERTEYVPDTFLARPRQAPGRAAEPEVVDVTERVDALRRAAGLKRATP